MTGTSQALQDDLSGKEILEEAGKGALVGGAAGGVLGGITGGISGGIKSSKIKKQVKAKEFVEDLVQPKPTQKVKEAALREGRITESGLLKGSKIKPSKRDVKLADAVKGLSFK